MRIHLVYSHPCEESFGSAVHRTALDALRGAGHEVDDLDLYAEGFQAVMSADERRGYDELASQPPELADWMRRVQRTEGLVFVYPTWWYGLPAMLKGYLDRVYRPGLAFHMGGDGAGIQPGLRHVRVLAGVSTYGASWLLTRYVGDPGRRTLMRGIGALCAPDVRKRWLALHRMDYSTPQQRERFLQRVHRSLSTLAPATLVSEEEKTEMTS
ncbi:NAD(P)H-dependent oxidoreductase [Acidihalobacter prosperus]